MFKDEVLAMRDSPVTLHNTSAKFRSHFLLRCGENSTSTLNHISELKAFFQNPSARNALQETIVSEPLAEGKFAFHFHIKRISCNPITDHSHSPSFDIFIRTD